MSAYNSFLIKHFYDKNDSSKAVVCKVTGIIPTKDNKGSLYVFNNEAHVALNDRETVKNFFINILKNINFCIETRGKEMMKELSQKETIN